MNIIDFLKIKNNFLEKSSIPSLMLRRNLQFTNNYKKKFNQVTSNSPFKQNILPLIHKFNSLNSTKQFSKNKKFISKKKKIMNHNNFLKINIKFNMSPLKYIPDLRTEKEKPKLGFIHNKENKEKNLVNYTEDKNKLNNVVEVEENHDKKEKEKEKETNKENKIKVLRKIINIYKGDETKKNINTIKIEKTFKKEERNINFTNNNRIIKPNSMFMTEMNFLINDKNKINNKNSMKKSREIRNINYDFFSFKELLKHIENDKKKIIDNQNDLDKMIKTTKDTYFEIWKYNHH